MPRTLALKVTCATDAPERANQGLTVAASAAASGAAVSLWLTGEAVWFGVAGRQPDLALPHATPAADLVDLVLGSARPDVVVCSQCALRREVAEADLVPGLRIAGAGSFAELVLGDDVQALVY